MNDLYLLYLNLVTLCHFLIVLENNNICTFKKMKSISRKIYVLYALLDHRMSGPERCDLELDRDPRINFVIFVIFREENWSLKRVKYLLGRYK